MPIVIETRAKDAKLIARQLIQMVPYRVVEAKEGYKEVEVDDIMMVLKAQYSVHVFNCTKELMLQERNFEDKFYCQRAHDVKRIYLLIDNDHT